jgi:hypothetical protein
MAQLPPSQRREVSLAFLRIQENIGLSRTRFAAALGFKFKDLKALLDDNIIPPVETLLEMDVYEKLKALDTKQTVYHGGPIFALLYPDEKTPTVPAAVQRSRPHRSYKR